MISRCYDNDIDDICAIINDAATAYKGAIPNDCWHEPYMSMDYLRRELERGVVFYGYRQNGELIGVMGMQAVQDVTLIRHAYVKTAFHSKGIGGELIRHILPLSDNPGLIGTCKAGVWAIRFYEKHGFIVVDDAEKTLLLRKYWSIPDRQIETSVVLVDSSWSAK